MRHPKKEYNQRQAEALAALPEEQRDYMARMFRIGNATYCYYNQINELAVFNSGDQSTASPEDLLEWLERQLSPTTESRSARELLEVYFNEYLEGIPHEGLRRAEKERGLNKARRSFPFRRYVLERHDIGMDEFLRMNLSAEDYAFHRSADAVECSKPLSDNNEPAQ